MRALGFLRFLVLSILGLAAFIIVLVWNDLFSWWRQHWNMIGILNFLWSISRTYFWPKNVWFDTAGLQGGNTVEVKLSTPIKRIWSLSFLLVLNHWKWLVCILIANLSASTKFASITPLAGLVQRKVEWVLSKSGGFFSLTFVKLSLVTVRDY